MTLAAALPFPRFPGARAPASGPGAEVPARALALVRDPPPAPPVPFAELIRRAQGGDHDAFGALYRAHVGRVNALALRLTAGDPVAAAELTQNAFVRAWEGLPRFRGESAVGSWLHRLVVNCFLAERRATGRRERRVEPNSELLDEESLRSAGGAGSGPGAGPGEALDLERAIAALPPRARMVFVLHDVEGYQHAEIAGMAGIAEGTSKAQLFRARRLLREALDR